ncbi:hypothetical protein [Streptomyces sp.]|uniref:hypothetical protein n=1 Tax=Streptomyces sp. TaxID=1931 RepID=UPI0025D77857|nr:hypothetical protein [Streptomyces sp.]
MGLIAAVAAGAFNSGAICGELGSDDLPCSPGGAVMAWGFFALIPGLAWLLTRMKNQEGFYAVAWATWLTSLFVTGFLVVLMPKA